MKRNMDRKIETHGHAKETCHMAGWLVSHTTKSFFLSNQQPQNFRVGRLANNFLGQNKYGHSKAQSLQLQQHGHASAQTAHGRSALLEDYHVLLGWTTAHQQMNFRGIGIFRVNAFLKAMVAFQSSSSLGKCRPLLNLQGSLEVCVQRQVQKHYSNS